MPMPVPMLAAALLLSPLACGDKEAGDDTGTSPVDAPTWHQDVAPIYAKSCMGCHTDGGMGPFRLDVYEDAATWATASAEATAARTMPPFLVTGDGTCGDFADNQWLSEEELATIQAWAEAGAPEGEAGTPVTPIPAPTLPEGTVDLSTPLFVPEIVGGEYAEFDEYRCFDLGEVTEEGYLTGYDVSPGNAAMVHHVLMMPVDPEAVGGGGRTAAEIMADLDAEDDREGWPCFSGAGNGVPDLGTPVAWAPGQGAVLYPEGTGVKLAPGQRLIAQVHYNLVDSALHGQSDQTTLHLLVEDEVEREGFFALPDGFLATLGAFNEAAIPPGEDAWTYTWSMQTLDLLYYYGGSYDGITGAELWGVMPHMHQAGEAMTVSIDGTCAAEVRQWDFTWQRIYFYEEGLPLTGEETLEVSCTWDTQGQTEEVTPGWGSYNEMCLPVLYVVLNRG